MSYSKLVLRQQFRGSERIISAVFPDLTFTAEQVFAVGILES